MILIPPSLSIDKDGGKKYDFYSKRLMGKSLKCSQSDPKGYAMSETARQRVEKREPNPQDEVLSPPKQASESAVSEDEFDDFDISDIVEQGKGLAQHYKQRGGQ